MRASHPREVIAELISVVHLVEAGDGGADDEAAENHIFHPDNAGALRQDAGSTAWSYKTLGRETGADGPLGSAHLVVIAHVREVELVHRARPKGLCVAEG